MKTHIDMQMRQRGIDALVVSGSPGECTDLYYLTGPAAISHCSVFKKRDEAPVLVVSAMERDEAAKSGLTVKTWDEFGVPGIVRETKDRLEGKVRSQLAIFEQLGIKGTVAYYGTGDIPYSYRLLEALSRTGKFTLEAEAFDNIFSELRMTKDELEIERMASINRKAQEVMQAVRDYLASCRDEGGKVVDPQGQAVTIGRVKAIIEAETSRRAMAHNEEVIFSQGRDSAVPHSRGDNDAVLVPGKTIVFDYTPKEANGGYYADITRTWCLGSVPREVQKIFDTVLQVHLKVLETLEVGQPCSHYDRLVNELFDEAGHPTPMKAAGSNEGYVHSLGHGLGLQVHERPWLTMFAKAEEKLSPGHVFTVEPGLYYPDQEIGVRLEDDIAIARDGAIINMTSLSKDLLIPLR